MNKKLFLSAALLIFFFCVIRNLGASNDSSLGAAAQTVQNKISLDIKGMDIVDVLRMLATRSGMNIVVGKNVSGRVTLFLKNVDIWDAFEIILLANDLAFNKKADIVNVMTRKDYELFYGEVFQERKQAKIINLKYAKAVDLARSLNQIKTTLGRIVVDEGSNTVAIIDTPETIKEIERFIVQTDLPVQTKIFDLNYASAEKLSPKLQEVATKGVGTVRIDERTNKIVVTDYPEKIEEIGNLIKSFDEKTPQVLIDAQIINLNPSDQFQMGVDWDFWIKKYFEVQLALPVNTTNTMLIGTTDNAPCRVGQYKAILDILRTIGDTKVLSSPRIIVLNNQEAKIHVGTRDAYITSTTSQAGSGSTVTSQSVNFVDWGIQLHVTPTINKDGFVTMKIKPELSDATRVSLTAEGQVTQVPIITTSESETTVMVKDGVTVIMGGLRKDKRVKTVKKVPVLGDIPGLGVFFRSIDDKIEQNELIILLTPHIMSGEKAYSDFSEIPPGDGAVAEMVKGNIVITKTSSAALNSKYYDYIVKKVKTLAAFNRPAGKKGEVKLSFVLLKDGSLIEGPNILESSEVLLNQAAMNAVKSAAPFQAFPPRIKKDKETFSISLSY